MEFNKNKDGLLALFSVFFRIGAFTFGGGYAMIPLIQNEIVEKRKWIEEEDIIDIITIAESTPGPISVNTATFVGYKRFGVLGAIVSTLGLVLPSFLIICIIATFFKSFQDIALVQYAFKGIRVGIIALIFKALYKMYTKCEKNLLTYLVMLCSFVAAVFFNIDAILIIIFSGIIGITNALLKVRRVK